jgi:hypothetical protein
MITNNEQVLEVLAKELEREQKRFEALKEELVLALKNASNAFLASKCKAIHDQNQKVEIIKTFLNAL